MKLDGKEVTGFAGYGPDSKEFADPDDEYDCIIDKWIAEGNMRGHMNNIEVIDG